MSNNKWRARDHALLDALDELPRTAVDRTVWRVVREGRDSTLCRSTNGRWDLGHFDVLYTSLDPNGAIAEMHYHLSRQPVFPSRPAYTLNELQVNTKSALKFTTLTELEPLGVEPSVYPENLYGRTQEIGDAAAFLGFDGLIAPSARWDCLNLVLFCDSLGPDDLRLAESSVIDWGDWRRDQLSSSS